MKLKLLHLSDLHITRETESTAYSNIQLEKIEHIYNAEQGGFDRVIVTGDLTNDHHQDSFNRAKSWLTLKILTSTSKKIGLGIDGDIKLKVVPGNKDFDFDALKSSTGESIVDKFYAGLHNYNRQFNGSHLFIQNKPITYDWFPGGVGCSVLIFYVNTSILGDDFNHIKIKGKYIDYLCDEIKKLYHEGLQGKLKEKRGANALITCDDFRKSFKILVSHHSLQSNSKDTLNYIDKFSKRTFLSNLGIMDFQMQLSGHKHVHDIKAKTYYRIFDKRAKNRYILNELKLFLGLNTDFSILTSSDGKKFSTYFSLIIHALTNLVAPEESNLNQKNMVKEIERLINENNKTLAQEISYLIRKGKKKDNVDSADWVRLKNYLSGLDETTRMKLEENSNNILSLILRDLRSKEITTFNSGSASIPYLQNEDRHFNIYEIETSEKGTKVINRHYKWINNKFEQEQPVKEFEYSEDKIKTSVNAHSMKSKS